MRLSLLLVFLLIISCNSEQSSSNEIQDSDSVETQVSDSIKVDVTTDFVTGQFDFTTHEDFVQVDPQDATREVYLHKDTYEAFRAMADSAEADGISFVIVSGTRNFEYQKAIWDRKWNESSEETDMGKALEILEYSSMPMTSRHHWGTDIDINNLNNSYFEEGQGRLEYEWLQEYANQFGFYQVYTDKSLNGRTGYNEEKWHWSYMPLASQYLSYYNQNVTNADITGFQGAELAEEIDMVQNYVNGVSVKIQNYQR